MWQWHGWYSNSYSYSYSYSNSNEWLGGAIAVTVPATTCSTTTTLIALVVLGVLSWWPKRAIRSCFDRVVLPLERMEMEMEMEMEHHKHKHNNKTFHGTRTARTARPRPSRGINDGETETRELSSLLEALREIPSLWETIEPKKDREFKKWELILNSMHEFPAILQQSIQQSIDSVQDMALEEQEQEQEQPETNTMNQQHQRIEQIIQGFFFGFMGHDRNGQLYGYNTYAIDDSTITNDEMEVVLRCFPEMMTRTFDTFPPHRLLHKARPIFALACSERSVSFVPLFAKIGAEIGAFKELEQGGLTTGINRKHNVWMQLLGNTILPGDFQKEASRELDARSLEALTKLRDMGMVSKKNESDMIYWHLLGLETSGRDFEFIASRLRLIINEWNPTILKDCEQLGSVRFGTASLLSMFLFTNGIGRTTPTKSRTFGLILELGLLHYPTEFGFVFCGNNLERACDYYGRDVACTIVENELSKILTSSNDENENDDENDDDTTNTKTLLLRDLVIEAASNTHITLDGVYTLIRRDPIALLHTKANRNVG